MNIFVTNRDPLIAAKEHCNKHVIKQILESAQMLCSAINYTVGEQITPYRATHINHPCSKWVRESNSNFQWLYTLMMALGKEYTYRYSKHHLTIEKMVDANLMHLGYQYLPDIGLTDFAQAMPDQYKNSDVFKAYQDYINGEKQHLFNWGIREIPEWINVENKV